MTPDKEFLIASFYCFTGLEDLETLRGSLIQSMETNGVVGTIIIAKEGVNGTVSMPRIGFERFRAELLSILNIDTEFKLSNHSEPGFKRRKVKIKKEIVTLRKEVEMDLGGGTHIDPKDWNQLISSADTLVIDARNDYEFKVGTFKGAVNPRTESFSELPEFIETDINPPKDQPIAMFCTGGIRCEKLAPYLIEKGFENVFQLKGGILKYLEEIQNEESLWTGECFVFDERVTVDKDLKQGIEADLSALKTLSLKKED